MNTRQLRTALKQATAVYVWVRIYEEDGAYIPVSKSAIRKTIRGVVGPTTARWGENDTLLYID